MDHRQSLYEHLLHSPRGDVMECFSLELLYVDFDLNSNVGEMFAMVLFRLQQVSTYISRSLRLWLSPGPLTVSGLTPS